MYIYTHIYIHIIYTHISPLAGCHQCRSEALRPPCTGIVLPTVHASPGATSLRQLVTRTDRDAVPFAPLAEPLSATTVPPRKPPGRRSGMYACVYIYIYI